MSKLTQEPYKIQVWFEELIPTEIVDGKKNLEHYEETYGITIGENNMSSPYRAINPTFKVNVNGQKDLTFTMYYRLFDEDLGDFANNPFTSMLGNESKIKLFFRGEWYDFVVKNRVEDSTNYTFTYTCKELYVNELGKNGFKVELDSELENNQDTAANLAEKILLDTDWQVDRENSDLLHETKTDPLYIGTLSTDIKVKRVTDYRLDEKKEESFVIDDEVVKEANADYSELTIAAGTEILIFYSDVVENKKHPLILFRPDQAKSILQDLEINEIVDEVELIPPYEIDANKDVIINAYNYEVQFDVYYGDTEHKTNIPNIFTQVSNIFPYRGEKLVKSQKSGYDPVLDKFIFKYYKLNEDGTPNLTKEYYGYSETEVLRSDLAQNYLANADNFITTEEGWVFDGVPGKSTKVNGKEKFSAYSGQVFELNSDNEENASDTVLVLQLVDEDNVEYYPDQKGEFYKITKKNGEEIETSYIKLSDKDAESYEDNIRAALYQKKEKGEEAYIDLTDDQIEATINQMLLDSRYSARSRVAINTGVAANRKAIGSLTPGEEFLFAVSLGKFTGEQGPNYGDGVKVSYGAKTPHAYYQFNSAKEHAKFIYDAAKEVEQKITTWVYRIKVTYIDINDKEEEDFITINASEVEDLDEAIAKVRAMDDGKYTVDESQSLLTLADNPYQYFLDNPDYKKSYDSVFEDYVNQQREKYEGRYTNLFKSGNNKVRENWDGGGDRFRNDIMLPLLRNAKEPDSEDKSTFPYNGEEVYFSDVIANRLLELYALYDPSSDSFSNMPSMSIAEGLYNIFLEGNKKEDNSWVDDINDNNSFVAENGVRYYQGVYPTMLLVAVNKAIEKQKDWWRMDARWDPLGYDKAQYPEFDDLTQDLLDLNNSFNELMFAQFYKAVREKYTTIVETEGSNLGILTLAFNESELDGKDAETLSDDLAALFRSVYKALEKDTTIFDNYDKARDYKIPDGKYYLLNLKKWENDATALARAEVAAMEQVYKLFLCPFDPLADTYDEALAEEKDFEDSGRVGPIGQRKDFVLFLIEKERAFKLRYGSDGVETEAYKKGYTEALVGWVEEYREKNPSGKYYLYEYARPFMESWLDEQEIGTYVLKEDCYDVVPLNDERITHYAVPTQINPYTGMDKYEGTNGFGNEAGGYVFDKVENQIRLFDPDIDMPPITYIPLKNEDGDYVYDTALQHYRPFRDWVSTEKRDPLTGELNNEVGVPGDIIEHPVKWFDGHLGAWKEYPTRYIMNRMRVDPSDTTQYTYLSEAMTITERGWYDGEEWTYETPYPAGYQYDTFEKADKGKYVLASEVKVSKFNWFKPKLVKKFSGFPEGYVFKDDSGEEENVAIVEKIQEETKQRFSFIDWIKSLFAGKEADLEDFETNPEPAGIDTRNAENINKKEEFLEDEVSVKCKIVSQTTDSDGDPVYMGCSALGVTENNATEMGELNAKGKLDKVAASTPAVIDSTEEAISFVKYKPFNWRHWGCKRYDYKPKICIRKNINGIVIFKPFNNVEDAISDDYKLVPADEYTENLQIPHGKPVVFNYRSFRGATEYDNGAHKYFMLGTKKTGKDYWVEDPGGQNYLRKYKWGDGKIVIGDGHIGKWIDCYQPFKQDADATLDDVKALYAEELEDIKADKKYLDDFYIPYGGGMVPYDSRIFANRERFTRIRRGYDEKVEQFVESNGEYITLDRYWVQNGFRDQVLNYDNLKVSFIDGYDYNATDFSIKSISKDRDKYLTFDLSETPTGTMDIVVERDPYDEANNIKERWCYWKASVKKGISLTEDPLQRFGMLFSYHEPAAATVSIEQSKVKQYPFLGMQLFRYIPYEKKIPELSAELIEPTETTWGAILSAYNTVFAPVDDESEQHLLYLDPNDPDSPETYLSRKNRNEYIDSVVTKYLATAAADKYSLIWEEDTPLLYRANTTYRTIPLFPGEAPDARDLMRPKYYIYDPDKSYNEDNIVFEYVGAELVDYIPSYDDSCEKHRSIKGKEQNYFNLIQGICDTFDCWLKVDVTHDENGKLNYIETPIYTEHTLEPNQEPQIYVGDLSYRLNVTDRIPILVGQLGEKIKPVYAYRFKSEVEPSDVQISELQKLNELIGMNELMNIQTIRAFSLIEENTNNSSSNPPVDFPFKFKSDINNALKSSHQPTLTALNQYINSVAPNFDQKILDEYYDQLLFIEKDIDGAIFYYRFIEKYEWDYQDNDIEMDDEKKLLELNRANHFENLHYIEYIKTPEKKISFKRYVGSEKWNGFKYGVDLEHIKRTVDSNQISTRVIVKPNKNEFGKDGFCTIQRAEENPIKENFLLDFSYYVQLGMLNKHELTGDLYVRSGTKLNYYNRLAKLNKDIDKNATELSSLQISLDHVTANYETAVLTRDAALEEIQKLALLLSSNYDEYGQIMDSPWTYNKSQEYVVRKQTSTPGEKDVPLSIQGAEEQPYQVTVDIPDTATAVDYPKYEAAVQGYLDQMDVFQKQFANSEAMIAKYGPEKEELERKIREIIDINEQNVKKKNELNKLFFHKYSRFLQEGSWIDENYIDDNLYYLDALSVLRNSSKPKITYDIGIVDISAAFGYEDDAEVLRHELGDRTYVEDVEFFGWTGEPNNSRPYWEMVVVSEITYLLDDASATKFQIKNYSTQFDDLFKRITATSQQLQFNEGAYSKVASIIKDDGTIDPDVLRESVVNTDLLLAASMHEKVSWDHSGITIKDTLIGSNIMRLVSGGLLLSSDGGNSFVTAITAKGINADLLLSGSLNTEKILIGGKTNPNFLWNGLGISAFKKDKKVDYSTFIRYDQYGIYGIKNYAPDGKSVEEMSINDSFAPKRLSDITNHDNLIFGLTWDGFILRTGDEDAQGRVTIGTGQDFKMSEFDISRGSWIDRVVIGKMRDNQGEEYYGFRINNAAGVPVMETDDTGELYLKRKLRIDNFDNETSIRTSDGKTIATTNRDRVSLGIVDIYSKSITPDNDTKSVYAKAYPTGRISPSQYLTKVMSVKASGYTLNNQFTDDDIGILIDPNENFAIFDNGNIYAKNAWIEGNIRATSGNILGQLVIGAEGDSYGSIVHADGSWAINGDGTAFFNNINVSGTISTAVFEYDKIQTIGGSMVICPTYFVDKIENYVESSDDQMQTDGQNEVTVVDMDSDEGLVENFNSFSTLSGDQEIDIPPQIYEYKVYLQMSDNPLIVEGIADSNDNPEFCAVNSKFNVYIVFNQFGKNSIADKYLVKFGGIKTEGSQDSNGKGYIIIETQSQLELTDADGNIVEWKDKPVFFNIESKSEGDQREFLGLVLNSADSSGFFPPKSLSIVNLNKVAAKPKLVLGLLSDSLFEGGNSLQQQIGGTYGLYAENAYLTGSLVSSNNGFLAGISTDLNTVRESDDRIVFFAGTEIDDISKLNFYVSESGYLYANTGFFSGEIEASTIKASTLTACKIVGSEGNTYALEIDGFSGEKGLIFWDADQEDNQSYVEFTKQGSFFYNKIEENVYSNLFAVLHNDNTEAIGLFRRSSNITAEKNDFLLSFDQNEEVVNINYKHTTVATIDETGFKLNGSSSANLGNAKVENIYNNSNVFIGIDIIV